MKIMQVIAGASHGGAETFFLRLVEAFARVGVSQRAATRPHPGWRERLAAAGVASIALPFGGPFDFITGRALKREIGAFRPDLVLAWMGRAARFSPAGPHVLVGRLGGYYDLRFFRRCDHLIGNTEALVESIVARGWPRERVHYMPNFAPAETAPASVRAALDTPDRAPLILALGRLHHNKAFDTLLAALAAVPAAYLWLAGEGTLRGDLEALAHRLGIASRVRFLGWREDGAALMQAADLVAVPSRQEPLGNVVLEAWAQKRPVIAAAAEGPAALIESGETGLLVPVDDPIALAAAIQNLIDDPAAARRLALAGHARFAAAFSEEAVVDRYLSLFEGLIAPCAV